MSARLFLLIAMLFGIAAGPVTPVLAMCAPVECHQCCADSAPDCCSAAAAPAPAPLAPVGHGDDGKLLAAPVRVVLYLSPIPVTESFAFLHSQELRPPAQPLFARHCSLLI